MIFIGSNFLRVSCFIFLTLSAATQAVEASWEEDFGELPTDEQGWTLLAPEENSRIIYVSESTGNDRHGKAYARSDDDIGENVFQPVGEIHAFKTIAAALAQARDGYPDWILLRKGDVWRHPGVIKPRRGQSAQARSIIASYGHGQQRPQIFSDLNSSGLSFNKGSGNFSVVSGISFYAYKRDPNSKAFIGFGKTKGKPGLSGWAEAGDSENHDILIEDCQFLFYNSGAVIQGKQRGTTYDVVLRRNQFRNAYSEDNHSQGLFSRYASLKLEENWFDHNGWYQQSRGHGQSKEAGQATIFNHNTYMADVNHVVLRGNLFTRASSIGSKFTANPRTGTNTIETSHLLLEDNLYFQGEVGVSIGGNKDFNDGPRFENIRVLNNVFLQLGEARPTNRDLAIGMDIIDWRGGRFSGNLMEALGDQSQVKNVYALKVSGYVSQTSVLNNHFRSIGGGRSGKYLVRVELEGDQSQVNFSSNWLEFDESESGVLSTPRLNGLTMKGNYAASGARTSRWFQLGEDAISLSQWQDKLAGSVQQIPSRKAPHARSLEGYFDGEGFTKSSVSWLALLSQQSKGRWDSRLTASEINAYIRQDACVEHGSCP